MISRVQYYLYVLVIVITLKLLLASVRSIDHTSTVILAQKPTGRKRKEGFHSSDKHTKVIRGTIKA